MKINKILIAIIFVLFAILIGFMIKQQIDIKEIKIKIGLEKELLTNAQTISKSDFVKHIEKVELTTENWKDYFELEEENIEEKNAWGEILSTKIKKHLKLKEPYYDTGELIQTTIELQANENFLEVEYNSDSKWSKRTISFYTTNGVEMDGGKKDRLGQYHWDNASIEDLQCTRIKGTLYYLKDFAESNWQNDSLGNKFINVENTIYYKNIRDIGKDKTNTFLKDFIDN